MKRLKKYFLTIRIKRYNMQMLLFILAIMDITTFQNETTIRWECMLGDYVLWTSHGNFLNIVAGTPPSIVDMWQMKNNDLVTITNKTEDLPSWFELHPTEISGKLTRWMMKKLNSGYKPKNIMDGFNIWRLKTGDRLVWVGQMRPWQLSENGVLGIIDFKECALAIGESEKAEDILSFGSVNLDGLPLEDSALCEAGLATVNKLGIPRTMCEDWKLGV